MLSDKNANTFLEISFRNKISFDFNLPQQVEISSCKFDVKHFNSELFSSFGIERSASITNSVSKRQAEFFVGRLMAKIPLEKRLPDCKDAPEIGSVHDKSPWWL
jgi:4'-phosphopantetheinyl transferase EntD